MSVNICCIVQSVLQVHIRNSDWVLEHKTSVGFEMPSLITLVPGIFFLSFTEGKAVDVEKTENLWDQGVTHFFP